MVEQSFHVRNLQKNLWRTVPSGTSGLYFLLKCSKVLRGPDVRIFLVCYLMVLQFVN